jgi:Protein kinase domain
MAEALEAAYEQSVIHRDLKPANVTLKVLDFGLAKALDTMPHPSDASQSPTISSPAVTRMGTLSSLGDPETHPIVVESHDTGVRCHPPELVERDRKIRGIAFTSRRRR